MVVQDIATGRQIVVGDTVNFPQPPTRDRVEQLFKSYTQHYKAFHTNSAQEDSYFYGWNIVPTPKDMAIDPVRPGTGHAKIRIAADHVDVRNPSIKVPDPSPRAKDRAEKIQKFLQAAWLNIDKKVTRTGVMQEISYGISFLKVMWDADQWPDSPQRPMFPSDGAYKLAIAEFNKARKISFPFVVKNVNPQNLIWDDSRTGMKWVIEWHESSVGDVKRLYPEWMPKNNKKNTDMVTFAEYWDDTWVGRMIDFEWVMRPMEHGYGFMPYEAVIPGTSLNWDVGRPELRFQGMLRPAHSLLDAEARVLTQNEAILRQYAWPTLDFMGNRIQAEETANAYELFGSKNVVLPGVAVEASPRPVPPPQLLEQLGVIRTLIDEVTFPDVVQGNRPAGISSGFGVSVLAGMGRLVFGPYADGMAKAMEGINQKFLKLIENKAMGKVTVRASDDIRNFDQTIGPDDIRGYYANTVTLKAEAPEEREREAILAERLHSSGKISLVEAQRRMGIINPLEEQVQMAAEQFVELMRSAQAEQLISEINLPGQLQNAVEVPGDPENRGNEFSPLLPQLQRPGERNIQQGRSASQQGRPSVFPQGQGGIGLLGRQVAGASGGGRRAPNGRSIP